MKINASTAAISEKIDLLAAPHEQGVSRQEKFLLNAARTLIHGKEGQALHEPTFDHKQLVRDPHNSKAIDNESLINILNYTHFMKKPILLHLRSNENWNRELTIQGYICASDQDKIEVRIKDKTKKYNISENELKHYVLCHLFIDDGLHMTVVSTGTQESQGNAFIIALPTPSYISELRRIRRHRCCQWIEFKIPQNGITRKGELFDFSAKGFRIRVPATCSTAGDFVVDSPLVVQLRQNNQPFFTGLCECIRTQTGEFFTDFVFVSADIQTRHLDQKQIRNPRQQLVPQPVLFFTHPFSEKRIQLDVCEISTSGFTVYEEISESVLIQGMKIPELLVEFAGGLRIKCSARVIYRSEVGAKVCRSGIGIVDMDINAYTCLADILGRSLDSHSHISNKVDMDELWEFFFNTGFIYPKKYGLIHSRRNQLKENFRKLYQETPEIARHFVYQDNGKICAHISMVRAYERAWLIHHHAARSTNGRRTGFSVLKQIVHYLKDMNRFPSIQIDHMMVYYRPENKFPDRVFGGFARSEENVGVCSTDLFSYLPYTNLAVVPDLPKHWLLKEASPLDLKELRRFYNRLSGGFLLDALSLDSKTVAGRSLKDLCTKLGFFRSCKTYSLRHKGLLKAVLIVNQSDMGFNLSELLNSIKILITNADDLPWKILSNSVSQLLGTYQMQKVPILFYPTDYVKTLDIPWEKEYQLWIYNARFVHKFIEFLGRKFRIRF